MFRIAPDDDGNVNDDYDSNSHDSHRDDDDDNHNDNNIDVQLSDDDNFHHAYHDNIHIFNHERNYIHRNNSRGIRNLCYNHSDPAVRDDRDDHAHRDKCDDEDIDYDNDAWLPQW